jgi:2-desacetyl-2-hydroxyethyl bacteriochlorophyllide A dehydrogenase
MKAAVFHGAGLPLVVENVADPSPLPHEVVIRVDRCGICTSDIHMMETGAFLSPGDVLGHECAGEVVACGSAVTKIRLGDHVAILPTAGCGQCVHCLAGEAKWCQSHIFRQGGYAEFIVAAESNCLPLPSAVSMSDGALVEPMAVALHGVVRAGVATAAKVLVIGAGPIGLAAMFWSRRLGAASVIGMASSRRHAAIAETMGIDAFIENSDSIGTDVVKAFRQEPDIVLECSGAPGLIAKAIGLVRPRGTVGVLGFCMQDDIFAPVVAISKEVDLRFAMTYGRRDFEQSIEAFDAGAIEPSAMITDTIGLEALPTTFESLRSRTHHCKVQVNPWA